jgi:acetyl-CoA C-acetyltransferase
MEEVVIVSAVRTPIGNFMGGLSSFSATRLGAMVIREAVIRAGIEDALVDEVIMGNVLPCGLGQNPARQAMLQAKIPVEAGALTVNKVCGSSLKAVMLAAQAIQVGDAEVVVAGGMECMSNAPYYLEKARHGYRLWDGKLVDGMVHDGLWDVINDYHMGYTAELVSEKFGISKEAQDLFSLDSNQKAIDAIARGAFREEIMPVEVKSRKGVTIMDTDEGPRKPDPEKIKKLAPVFKEGGLVTAGNSSKLSDGASALVVMSATKAKSLGLHPMVRILSQAAAGVPLEDVLVAPIKCIPKVLKKAGWAIADVDLFEINEAFAASTVAIFRTLEIAEEKVNVHGGAVALGHPIGCSGARVLTTLLYAMKEKGAEKGLATLCLGGGEAVGLTVQQI